MQITGDVPASVDLLGKHSTDLQTGVTITGTDITGTLKYVTGYTGFSGDVSEQSGNYLALKLTTGITGASIKIKYGNKAEKTMDDDGLLVLRVASLTNKLRVRVVEGDTVYSVTTFDLSGLTLEEP